MAQAQGPVEGVGIPSSLKKDEDRDEEGTPRAAPRLDRWGLMARRKRGRRSCTTHQALARRACTLKRSTGPRCEVPATALWRTAYAWKGADRCRAARRVPRRFADTMQCRRRVHTVHATCGSAACTGLLPATAFRTRCSIVRSALCRAESNPAAASTPAYGRCPACVALATPALPRLRAQENPSALSSRRGGQRARPCVWGG